MKKIYNIFYQIIIKKRFKIIIKKIIKKFFDKKYSINKNDYYQWLDSNCEDLDEICHSINKKLWEESKFYNLESKKIICDKTKDIKINLGGGGCDIFLFFCTRLLKPKIFVETGVAKGISSRAVLKAMEINNKGMLYSSDFPYFRIQNPERYIGLVVEDNLKKRWKLYLDGDEKNLPLILNQIDIIEIFHYDSDKSYSGRAMVLEKIKSKLNSKSLLIFDDIVDNTFFYDYLKINKIINWKIFKFENKFVGYYGKL